MSDDTNRPRGYEGAMVRKAQQALASGMITPGRAYTIQIAHDDWCALLAGRGACDCDPIIGNPIALEDNDRE